MNIFVDLQEATKHRVKDIRFGEFVSFTMK